MCTEGSTPNGKVVRITMPRCYQVYYHCYQVSYIPYRHRRYPTSYTPNPMPHRGFYTERRLTMPHCYQVLLPGLGV